MVFRLFRKYTSFDLHSINSRVYQFSFAFVFFRRPATELFSESIFDDVVTLQHLQCLSQAADKLNTRAGAADTKYGFVAAEGIGIVGFNVPIDTL